MRIITLIAVVIGVAVFVTAAVLSDGGSKVEPRVALANAASGLAAGDYHSCALTEAGGVKCWGWNPYGELGDGRACGFSCPYVVSTSELDSGVVSIAAGGYHTCAIKQDGSAMCWGANASGQLGDGSVLYKVEPVAVTGLDGPVQKLTAGYNHTCALLESGGVQCWGDNQFGELGTGGSLYQVVPTDIPGLTGGVVDIAAGGFSTCAVMSSGAAKCWGYNALGQLGDGTTQDRTAPVTGSGLATAESLRIGESQACALIADGAVKCWGSNHEGQLGNGSTIDSLIPTDVPGLVNGVSQVRSGGYHTCALLDTSGVKCWGENAWSQLGDSQACSELCSSPVDVAGLGGEVTELDSGLRHSCAILETGDVVCWGADDSGQLARGTRDPNLNPLPRPPIDVDLKAPITITPPQLPTFTPTPTALPGVTPPPTATPYGTCGAVPNSITNGPRVGMTTDHSTKIWVRSCRTTAVTVQIKLEGSDWTTAESTGSFATDPAKDDIAVVPIQDLQPRTAYQYRVLVNNQQPAQPLEGRFETLPPEGDEATFSFLIGTDMHLPQFPMATVTKSIQHHNPLFGLLDGDNVLVEIFQIPGISRGAFENRYSESLSDPDYRRFAANLPTAMIWSDHEIYNDWDHRSSPPYPYARAAFDEYMSAANPPGRDPAGVQFTFKAADLEFYVIDDRTFRSPGEKVDGPDKTMLGVQQKEDLKNWLQSSTARFKFIVSDVWWNDFSPHAAWGESWPVYSNERDEIFDFIQDNHIPGVVLISGDEHITGVFKMEPWGIYEIAPGPMSWTPSPSLSPDPQILYTAGHVRVFGIFDVDTTACPAKLTVKLYNDTNQLLYTLPLTERDLGADVDGDGLVPCEEGAGPTPTPTRSPTPTPQRVRGDASCDGAVNSIDAALILQRTAGLLPNVPCPQNADVNDDGQINSIDASLVLQYAAGLLDEFP